MISDAINGTFELSAGGFILLHCAALWRDRYWKGLSRVAVLFFASWGAWNLYYYPALGQWWSFAGGILVLFANVLYVFLLFYFPRKP